MSSVTVHLSGLFPGIAGERRALVLEAGTVDEALTALDAAVPGIRRRLCDERGRLKLFVRIFVGEQDIRLLDGQATRLPPGAVLEIAPAISGGA